TKSGGGAEYFVGGSPGVNITVNLFGGVSRPGIYHLPENTDVLTLLGYGGGSTERAKLEDVIVRRRKGDGYQTFKLDVSDLLTSNDITNPRVSNGDVIF